MQTTTTTNNTEECLTLDFLQSKLNQAQRDVELFTIMIQELNKLISEKKKIIKEKTLEKTFLKLITT